MPKPLNLGFKALVLLLFGGVLYFELTRNENLSQIWNSFFRQLGAVQAGWLLLALALMPLNWMAETQKWHPIICRFEPMSRWSALRAVLAGVAVSLFTPHRVGEFAGRILFVSPKNRWKAIVVNLIGNFAQTMVLLTTGVFGALWMLGQIWEVETLYLQVLTIAATIALTALFLLYYNLRLVLLVIKKLAWLRRFKGLVNKLRFLAHFNRQELSHILKWAALRYGIFATQYLFLLNFFGIKTSLIVGYAGISIVFLFQTILPLPLLTGLVVRGNIALYLWGQIGASEICSLAATFTLWIINLILPALLGTISIFFVNTTKLFVYENHRN
ncbi:MAG: lysylphosphatidylglycerol synthase domain-containing protein [Saprospiraceae bacterium]